MKRVAWSGLLLCVLFTSTFAIGLQHGVFRSQSTQGKQWTGTATIIKENFDITVFPDYLDVELEWVFKADGTEPEEYKDALEIVGNINLAANSSVVSMLVWYQDKILKAKLKTDGVARDEYEAVVERDADAPPPPRDPVLLQYGWGKDNYDISIFPVSFGGTRKLRMRYLIPGSTVNGKVMMGYPYAFTDSATVRIKTGEGVSGYIVETSKVPVVFDNTAFAELPRSDFSFKAHAPTSGGMSISGIVPQLPYAAAGSRFYTGAFSTDSFSGSMTHLSTPGVGAALVKSSLPEDYVVLWRWNHPEVLQLYTRQVAEQAGLLSSFFTALNKTSKRGALIISKLDGESKIFRLDRRGGAVFDEMVGYLEELAALPVPQNGSMSSTKLPADEAARIAQQSFEEFKQALKDAAALFESNDAGRHLLILTAGPEGINASNSGIPDAVDKSITVSYFATFFGGSAPAGTSMRQSWPGVALDRVISAPDTTFKIFAYLSNGVQTDSFKTVMPSPYGAAATSDRYLYSDKPLSVELTWKIFRNNEVVSEFTETPSVVEITDGMQYARCIGSLGSMMPLAETMPTSLASTLGFIDTKYSLLALEEDALDPAVAAAYETGGVPLLEKADIFPSDSEKAAIPVADWLVANPREFASEYSMVMRGGIMFDMAVPEVLEGVKNGGAVRFANQAAEVITADGMYLPAAAYEVAPVVRSAPVKSGGISMQMVNRLLTIDFGVSASQALTGELVVYDLRGRVLMRIRLDRLMTGGMTGVQLRLSGITRGLYLIRLEKCPVRLTQQVMIR